MERLLHEEDTAIDPKITDSIRWPKDIRQFSRKVWMNVCMTGVIYGLTFTSFLGLADLQSSLHIVQGLGVVCHSIVYATLSISSLLLPQVMLQALGQKRVIVISLCGYVLWMAANGYATWVTMTIASAIVGICAGPLWTAHSSYINDISVQYARRTGKSVASVISLTFGVSLGIFKTSRFLGSLLSWAVLQNTWRNSTESITEDSLEYCGANDCPWLNSTNIYYNKPEKALLWMLVGIYLAIGVASILCAVFFLDALPRSWTEGPDKTMSKKAQVWQSLTAAGKLHSKYQQVLLIPISVYSGLIQSFPLAEFNKSFVTCSLGIWMVGLVTIPSALLSVISALLSGAIAKKTGRLPLILISFALDAFALLFCLYWQPDPAYLGIHFIIAMMIGYSDGIRQSQMLAVIGLIFPNDVASFANYRAWQAVGYSVALGTNSAFCVRDKIYMTLAVWMVAVVCYVVLVAVQKWERSVEAKDNTLTEGTSVDI